MITNRELDSACRGGTATADWPGASSGVDICTFADLGRLCLPTKFAPARFLSEQTLTLSCSKRCRQPAFLIGLQPIRASVAHRYGQQPFGRWGEVLGGDIGAAAMTDRLVHLGAADAYEAADQR
jgi:hypothetical protein